MNPNSYARSTADAVDRVQDPNDMRPDRSYLRDHGRLERKMRRILDPQQFTR